jgi:hypothetical protein
MPLEPKPILKEIFYELQLNRFETLILSFSNGDGKGSLDVELSPSGDKNGDFSDVEHPRHEMYLKLLSGIEKWAWSEYRYNGAGDGAECGNTVTYYINKRKVKSIDWMVKICYGEEMEADLVIENKGLHREG